MKKNRDLDLAKLRYEFKMGDGEASFTPILEPHAVKHKKAMSKYKKKTVIVTVEGVEFDADVESVNLMSSVLTLANSKIIAAVAGGASMADATAAVYAETIPWKDANDIWREIPIGLIPEGLEISLKAIAAVISEG